jgi:hypothetical protein
VEAGPLFQSIAQVRIVDCLAVHRSCPTSVLIALTRSKISQTLSVYDQVQRRIGSFFEELAARKSTASYETTSSAGASVASGMQEVDVIQRFQDACEFGGGGQNFIWKLKPESTLLITLHWVFNVSMIYICRLAVVDDLIHPHSSIKKMISKTSRSKLMSTL